MPNRDTILPGYQCSRGNEERVLLQWSFGISLPCRALNEIGRAASCAAGCMPLPFSSTQWKSALLIIVMHLCRKGKVKKNQRKSVLPSCHPKHVLHLVWSAPIHIFMYMYPPSETRFWCGTKCKISFSHRWFILKYIGEKRGAWEGRQKITLFRRFF